MDAKESDFATVRVHGNVLTRALLLYGLYTLAFDIFFLLGYYLLPEGFMRRGPQMAAGTVVASTQSFWPQFGLTVLFNLGIFATVAVVSNFNQVRGIPAGYLIPPVMAVIQGLILGTNSFLADNLDRYSNVREALALGKSIGGVETLAFLLIIAATVRFGVYQYRSWWRWSGEWKPTKVMRLRDVRLSKGEVFALVLGVCLMIIAAYRETAMPTSL